MSSTTSHSTDAQSLDTVLALLRNEHRRHALAALAEKNDPVSVRELAEAVAAREIGADTDDVPSETTDRVAASLYHVHLPKLADADAVAYDTEENTVSLARAEGVTPFLNLTDESR